MYELLVNQTLAMEKERMIIEALKNIKLLQCIIFYKSNNYNSNIYYSLTETNPKFTAKLKPVGIP